MSKYSPQFKQLVLNRYNQSHWYPSLAREIAQEYKIPHSTFYSWISEDRGARRGSESCSSKSLKDRLEKWAKDGEAAMKEAETEQSEAEEESQIDNLVSHGTFTATFTDPKAKLPSLIQELSYLKETIQRIENLL